MPSAVLSAIVDELAGPAMVTAGYVLWGMNVMPLGPTSGVTNVLVELGRRCVEVDELKDRIGKCLKMERPRAVQFERGLGVREEILERRIPRVKLVHRL